MKLLIKDPTKKLNGIITPPGSKSYTHRALILSGFADGISIFKNVLLSEDIHITLKILKSLGVKLLPQKDGSFIVSGKSIIVNEKKEFIDCKNSGTSIRIFTALSLLIEKGLKMKGEFFRLNRPMLPLLKALEPLGAKYSLTEDSLEIERDEITCDSIEIRGDISSQFITALLFLIPLIRCISKEFVEITLKSPIISFPYIQITLEVLKKFGVNVIVEEAEDLMKFVIETGQQLRTQVFEIPSDFSSIAFIMAATVLSPEDSEVIIENLDFENPQGDKRIIEILKEMGAELLADEENRKLIVKGNLNKYPLQGIEIDCMHIPDLFPILAVLGAYAEGKTTLFNAKNLRLKESDRIAIIARELRKMGVNVDEEDGKLIIYHSDEIKGTKLDHENDHRIAMALTIASLYATGKSKINNIEVVKDSYPQFLEDLISLGAKIKKS